MVAVWSPDEPSASTTMSTRALVPAVVIVAVTAFPTVVPDTRSVDSTGAPTDTSSIGLVLRFSISTRVPATKLLTFLHALISVSTMRRMSRSLSAFFSPLAPLAR